MTGEGTTSADSSAQARAVRASITAAAATAVPTGTSTHAKPSGEKFPPILHASVDWRPDEDTDVRVRIDSRPLQVVLHPALLLRLARFFQSPGAHGLRAALVTRLRAIQTRTTAELLAVLAENRQLDVLVNVAAPYVELVCVWQCPGSSVVCRFILSAFRYVIVPKFCTRDTVATPDVRSLRLVADLGNLRFASKPKTVSDASHTNADGGSGARAGAGAGAGAGSELWSYV